MHSILNHNNHRCLIMLKIMGFIIRTNLSWSQTQAKFCQIILSLSLILLQLKLTKLKHEVLKSDYSAKKKDTNTGKLKINWQNFAQARLYLRFAFIIRAFHAFYRNLVIFVKKNWNISNTCKLKKWKQSGKWKHWRKQMLFMRYCDFEFR